MADQDLARRVHHLAYHDVVERQFGGWDDNEQDVYEAAWTKHDHEILEWNANACGYLAVEVGPAGVDIHELVVHPDYQNRAIGTGVVREAISLARERGVPALLHVLLENRAARLYERLGFQECGRSATHRVMRLTP